ncbi:MAG: TIGR01777 family oxidoreductase [Gammaproteobacteria bacterium]|nr:TIGR01777 family oxidoreductase [Gammaproteobacteria bacterium]MDP2142161.1 TIGR01777 family oxidoreductase [Gammaproteobacteria bacterium]MDP2348231.1 TIGR01777 family oxidoreductase [Gammaproteobacteria bacterium]
MRILITGGSGFLGQALTKALLSRGDEVIGASRRPQKQVGKAASTWVSDLNQIQGQVDAVINLTGENLFTHSWSAARKEVLRDSRIAFTWKLVSWICSQAEPPGILLSGSAIGFYGDGGELALTEDSPPGTDWASALVGDWEKATAPASSIGVRTVLLRTGLVLGDGGLLKPLLPMFRLRLGGSLGRGQFWYSWIHVQDWVNATLFLLDSADATGPFNLTAPNPVRYREFAEVLGSVLQCPVWLTPPAWVLRLLLGERASLMLGSTRALPQRLQEMGFVWQHETLPEALQQLLKK